MSRIRTTKRASPSRNRAVARVRHFDRAVKAHKGAELEFIRTAGPRSLAQVLAQLEAKGEIVNVHEVSAAPPTFELDTSADVEIDLEDEDLGAVDVWHEHGSQKMDVVTLGEDPAGTEPLVADVYELIVRDGVCSSPAPEWAWNYIPITQRARETLGEIAALFRMLRRLAEWLNKARSNFLRSRDFWDFGPADLTEVEKGCAVLQKDLLQMLNLHPPLREETFSRFIRQCELVWPDGSAPVQILFSKEAKMAWVARAVLLFHRQWPSGKGLGERLGAYRNLKVSNKTNATLSGIKDGSLTMQDFIIQINAKAGTSWNEVLTIYAQRLV